MVRECHLGQVWCFAIPRFPEFAIRGIQEQPATRPLPLGQPLALGLLKENAIVLFFLRRRRFEVDNDLIALGLVKENAIVFGERKRHCFFFSGEGDLRYTNISRRNFALRSVCGPEKP